MNRVSSKYNIGYNLFNTLILQWNLAFSNHLKVSDKGKPLSDIYFLFRQQKTTAEKGVTATVKKGVHISMLWEKYEYACC